MALAIMGGFQRNITQTAGHKLPGKLHTILVLHVLVQSRPVPSHPVPRPVQHDHHDRGDHEEVGSYMRKLEIVHKEVGGCTQGSWRLSDHCRVDRSI